MSTAANPDLDEADAELLQAAFAAGRPMTVGVEEELMLLDPTTLDLAPVAPVVLERLDGDARFKAELPAAQLEIALDPVAHAGDVGPALAAARAALVQAAGDLARPAGGGAHPFAAPLGALSPGDRYAALACEYGPVLRAQLVFGLHVHVAIGDAGRALSVYNTVREYLPALAALGAAAPFYAGRDTGLASVRPKLGDLLPRQGVPPALRSWVEYAEALRRGAPRAPAFADAQWWWEARLHPVHGTLEIRVPDTQATAADTAAVAAVVHALVATLADRHDAGALPEPAAPWVIAENRWSACRHGVEGDWLDAAGRRTVPMRERLHALLDELGPAAQRLGGGARFERARDLVERPRARRARALGVGDPRALAADLAERFMSV